MSSSCCSIQRWRMVTPILLTCVLALCLGVHASPAWAQEASEDAASQADAAGDENVELPADDGGDAVPAKAPSRSLLQLFREGGMLMYPLLFCSFIFLVFVFERVIALRRGRVIPKPFVKRLLHQLREGILDREQALLLCGENKSPIATVFAAGLKKWGRPAVEVEQAMMDAGERAANGLRKYLRIFNGLATVGPLLGLLGTVIGMITAFQDISSSDVVGRTELFAKGISEALMATAFGLIVAIPSLITYLLFVGRVDQLLVEIDGLALELVALVSAEGQQESPAKTARASRRETPAHTTH